MRSKTLSIATLSGLFAVLVGLIVLAGCGGGNSGKQAQTTNSTATSTNATPNYNTGNPLTAPVDYLNTAVKAEKNMVKTIDVSYLNAAVERYNVQEGRYPKDLQELVPNYVAKLPTPPYGTKLDYNPNTGAVKVVNQ